MSDRHRRRVSLAAFNRMSLTAAAPSERYRVIRSRDAFAVRFVRWSSRTLHEKSVVVGLNVFAPQYDITLRGGPIRVTAMIALTRKQSGNSNVEISPPSSELLEVAHAVCEAASGLSKLRETIRSTEQRYRQAKAAATDAQYRYDHLQGGGALAELIAAKSAVERAETELYEVQRLLPVKEAEVAELDARHRTMVAELIRPLRALATDRYRAAASELRTARNLYCDIGFILYEQDSHVHSIRLADLESRADLLYEPNRKTAPFVTQYQLVRRAIAQGRRR